MSRWSYVYTWLRTGSFVLSFATTKDIHFGDVGATTLTQISENDAEARAHHSKDNDIARKEKPIGNHELPARIQLGESSQSTWSFYHQLSFCHTSCFRAPRGMDFWFLVLSNGYRVSISLGFRVEHAGAHILEIVWQSLYNV